MRVTLIHNPKAGQASGPDAQGLVGMIRQFGHQVAYQSSQEKGWQAVLRKPADLVVAAGGDGIISKVGRLLIGQSMPLAVLPTGTANNISTTLGVAGVPLEKLISSWATARRQTFDVGVAKGPWGQRYFLEGSGTGLFAWTLVQLAKTSGFVSSDNPDVELRKARRFLLDHLEDFAPVNLRVEMDGKEYAGEFILLEAMNIQSIGPNLRLAPEADPGDGQLDVVLVTAKERNKLARLLQNGGTSKTLGTLDFNILRGRNLQLQGGDLAWHFDDRPWPEKVTVLRGGSVHGEVHLTHQPLHFLVPA